MINFEDLSIYYEDKDIKEFYDEYNTICNPTKLLEIAKRGILLYEPLDSVKLEHPYLVDISVLAHQNFMVSNIDHYNRFKVLIVHDQYNDEYIYNNIFNLLIVNKTFIDFFIFDNDFIEYLMNNDKSDDFSYYVRIILKLVEYGYVEETEVHNFFSQGISPCSSFLTTIYDFLTTINDRLSNDSGSDNSCEKDFSMNMDFCNINNTVQDKDVFSTGEKDNVEYCQELLVLQNFFYLNNGMDDILSIFNEYNLIDFESSLNNEEYEDILNLLMESKNDIKSYSMVTLNKNQNNTLLLDNINDINMIYLFDNNPNLFNKYDIHSSFNKFPTSFPIKIMQKYSHVFVNYINKDSYKCQNLYVGELINGCKNDEFIEILNQFGFFNSDTLNQLPLYHRKHINYHALLSFEPENYLIKREYDKSYLPKLSLNGVPFLSL